MIDKHFGSDKKVLKILLILSDKILCNLILTSNSSCFSAPSGLIHGHSQSPLTAKSTQSKKSQNEKHLYCRSTSWLDIRFNPCFSLHFKWWLFKMTSFFQEKENLQVQEEVATRLTPTIKSTMVEGWSYSSVFNYLIMLICLKHNINDYESIYI